MPHGDQPGGGLLPGMPAAAVLRRSGRKGRRTGAMVRIARQRVADLFDLAERESRSGHSDLADRYVVLARRIGMRYNVRLLSEYRELYCRSCSTFWVEGRTVRTRLREGRRVRTCLRCGHRRRTKSHTVRPRLLPSDETDRGVRRGEGALAVLVADEADVTDEETEDE
jgi:ribonuclease P protein subunit RPR2